MRDGDLPRGSEFLGMALQHKRTPDKSRGVGPGSSEEFRVACARAATCGAAIESPVDAAIGNRAARNILFQATLTSHQARLRNAPL